jgi:hypothetical protein
MLSLVSGLTEMDYKPDWIRLKAELWAGLGWAVCKVPASNSERSQNASELTVRNRASASRCTGMPRNTRGAKLSHPR